jgi:UDPglucose 6-dehydrogenase
LRNKKIAVLGLSFKPDTDDIREAASTRIINLLLSKGAKVQAFDPVAMDKVRTTLGNRIKYSANVKGCLKNADCCLIVTEWNEFTRLKAKDFVDAMRRPIVIDGRRIYDPRKFSKTLTFRAIGLGKSPEGNV